MLIYIHGFNSSSASVKAGLMRQKLAQMNLSHRFRAPDLSHWPGLAIGSLESLLQNTTHVTLIGSSLGGYYATYLAEKHEFKAVLLNPAVRPYELLEPMLGPQKNLYTGEQYELTRNHLEQLRALEVPALTCPSRYLLLVQTGDATLDYRVAVERYGGAQQVVIPGGDHGFQDFGRYLDTILGFAGNQD